jgi:hypothetical protein
MDGDDGPVDIADQTVAKNDIRDFPIAAHRRVWQRAQSRNPRGCASGLISERRVDEFGQFGRVFSNGGHRVLQSVAMLPPYRPARRMYIGFIYARRGRPHPTFSKTIKQVTP